MEILLKRAYEKPEAEDGFRVLVDRLWPRGKKKADLRLDAWTKDIAPSTELRKWFGHDPKRWLEFCERYEGELKNPGSASHDHPNDPRGSETERDHAGVRSKRHGAQRSDHIATYLQAVSHPPNRVIQKHARVAAKC